MKLKVVSRAFCSILAALLLFFALQHAQPAYAQQGDAVSLPLMFDPRERLQRSDLSSVKRIRFLTTVDFPPFNFIDQSGKLSGFHVDLAREICRELNVLDRCQIEAVPYADIRSALEKGNGEVIAAGLRITPELRRDMGLSRVFMQLPARFVMLGGAGIKDPSSLKPDELGVVKDTAHAAMLTAYFPNVRPKPYDTREAMLAALKKGEIKAAFGDGLQLSFWLESWDAANCCTYLGGNYYAASFFGDGLALVTRKDEPLVTRAMDAALLSLARNGRLNEIYLRYFPNGL